MNILNQLKIIKINFFLKILERRLEKCITLSLVKIFLHNWNKENSPPLPQQEVISVVDNVKKTHDRKNQLAPLFVQTKEDIRPPEDLFNP